MSISAKDLAKIEHLEMVPPAGVYDARAETSSELQELPRPVKYTVMTSNALPATTLGQYQMSLRLLSARRGGAVLPEPAELAEFVEAQHVIKGDAAAMRGVRECTLAALLSTRGEFSVS